MVYIVKMDKRKSSPSWAVFDGAELLAIYESKLEAENHARFEAKRVGRDYVGIKKERIA
jgi:hypothetical protein